MKQPITTVTLHYNIIANPLLTCNILNSSMKFFTFKFELFKPPFSVVCLWWRLIKVILFYNIEKHFSCSQTLKLWTTTSSWQTKQPRQCLGCTNYWWLVKCTWFLKHNWKFGLITLLPWDKIRNGAFQESRRNIG